MSDLTERRLQIRANEFSPAPLAGKCRLPPGWPSLYRASAETVASWEDRYPQLRNTAALTRDTPALDTDIYDPEAADAIGELVRDRYDGCGTLLTRFGRPPKRAFLFRTARPFSKITVRLKDPHGGKHRIEVLGDGQQLVIDGTHPDTGRFYSWHGDLTPWTVTRDELIEIDEAEARALVEQIVTVLQGQFGFTVDTDSTSANGLDNNSPADFLDTDGKFDVDSCLAAMPPSGEGANDTQPRCLLSLLQRGWLPDEAIDKVLIATMAMANANNLGWDRDNEIRAVTARCVCEVNKLCREYDPTAGTIPPWLVGEFHEAWVGMLSQGRRPWLVLRHGSWQVCPASAAPESQDESASAGTAKPEGTDNPAGGAKNPGMFVLRPFVAFDPAELPPREFLYGRHYQRATVSATAAPGGSGKTSLCLVECIAMATCRDLLGEQPTQRLRVWFHNGEDNLEELRRRVAAICQHFSIPLGELEGWLFLTSGDEVPLRVATGYGDLKINSALIATIHSEIARNEIDVAVFDPLVTLHSVSENDPGKMDSVVGVFKGVAAQQQCAIVLVHHTRKQASGANGADYVASDMRGTSATHDAVRALRLINHMSQKEAEAAAIREHERTSYIRVDRGKGNNSPPTKAVWRRIVNVDLPNGDEVGVVIPWNFPGQDGGPPTAEMSEIQRAAEHVFLQLLGRFTLEGRVVSDRKSVNYAPTLFAQEAEAKIAKVGREALIAAMRRLFATKRIRAEDTGTGGHRVHRLTPA